MDLRLMLNKDGGGAGKLPPQQQQPASLPPPPPPNHLQQRQPSLHGSAGPPAPIREYQSPAQAPSGQLQYPAREYGVPTAPPPSAASYGASPPPGYPVALPPSYGPKPTPPPLQALPPNDVRSPTAASAHRPTPTSSTNSTGGGYFPIQPAPISPGARQPSYPTSAPFSQRDSYSQPAPQTPVGIAPAQPPTPAAYFQAGAQGPPNIPQTPPIATVAGTPGGVNAYYPHQRSQSTHSTSTPTSAHSQHQYGAPFVHTSPVLAHHQIPHPEPARQPSQPPTPLGPPLSAGARLSHGMGSVAQPPSPFQQRISSSAGSHHHQQLQASPPATRRPSTSRMSASQQMYDGPLEGHRRSQSQSERDRSISVSPKTRVPSLPSSAGNPSVDSDHHRHFAQNSAGPMEIERERGAASGKRKLDDRDLKSDEIDRQEPRPPPFAINGAQLPSRVPPGRRSTASSSPVTQRKRRRFYRTEPAWAQVYSGKSRLHSANFVLRKTKAPHVNGHQESLPSADHVSRQASPEIARSTSATQANNTAPPARTAAEEETAALLGPWEASLLGRKPYEDIPKKIADWLFTEAVGHGAMGEITSRGVQFEIEAKLGVIISRDTNDRVRLPVASECLLQDDGRWAFRSSMTETQHKLFNEYLNNVVYLTDPRHPDAQANHRVQVLYTHRREIDKFYELPMSLQDRLPACIRTSLKRGAKVRVTYEQKTNKLLAAIVKARVSDRHLHFPDMPLDCRFSINLEMPWQGPVEELERLAMADPEKSPDRNKDRLSYSQGHYQVDLTQVTQVMQGPSNTQRMEKEHELEIELAPAMLFQQAHRARDGLPHRYPELVEGFIDNVRLLARKAREFDSQM